MNITIDNYEAYLIDYLDGQLTGEESRELELFVNQQGLDFKELVKDLPILEPKAIGYEHKALLKRHAKVLPLFTKTAAAAAAVALLFALFWNQNETPTEQQPLVKTESFEMQPIENETKIHPATTPQLAEIAETAKTEAIRQKDKTTKPKRKEPTSIMTEPTNADCNRKSSPLLANLEPIPAYEIQYSDDFLVEHDLFPQLPFYPIYHEDALAETNDYPFTERQSWLEKGFLWATNGAFSKLSELIHQGTHHTSHEVIHYTTKAALTAYYMIDSRIDESRERFKNEQEE